MQSENVTRELLRELLQLVVPTVQLAVPGEMRPELINFGSRLSLRAKGELKQTLQQNDLELSEASSACQRRAKLT